MKKLISILLVVLLLMTGAAALADGEQNTVVIINRDRTIVRAEDGTVLGRLVCLAPVTVMETDGEMTLIQFPKGLYELWQTTYTLKEYGDNYTGTGEGWVKTECLTEVPWDGRLYHWAQDCRWELWTQGVYHKLHDGSRFTTNENFDKHPVPVVQGIKLEARMTYSDLLRLLRK